jgi:cytochrome c peroxidase
LKQQIFIVLVLISILFACKKDPEIPVLSNNNTEKYEAVVPEGWPAPVYNFAGNAVTYNVFQLGRHLFYDPLLSEDTSVSCGSCHQQIFAFTNGPSHALSHGVHDQFGNRNSPPIFNINWHPKIMWDGSVSNLENQPLGPIQNPVEMNLPIVDALNRVGASTKYKQLFKDAYGDTVVTSQRFLKAFAQFMGLMVSYNSKYDKVKAGNESFTASESNGYTVFKNNCASCHAEPLFSTYGFKNNGLPVNGHQDSGRYKITQDPLDMFCFKVQSLRNLGFSAPYMHDGRFSTLSQVLNHYTSGISNTPNLDPQLSGGIPLTTQQKNDLLSFLATLNDYTFINDPRFTEIH